MLQSCDSPSVSALASARVGRWRQSVKVGVQKLRKAFRGSHVEACHLHRAEVRSCVCSVDNMLYWTHAALNVTDRVRGLTVSMLERADLSTRGRTGSDEGLDQPGVAGLAQEVPPSLPCYIHISLYA